MSLGPFDLTGGPFLALYGVLLVVTIVSGWLIPNWLRPDGGRVRAVDRDQLAILTGGKARFVDTVVARLLAGEQLRTGGKYFWTGERDGRSEVERQALALTSPIKWQTLEGTLGRAAEPVERGLIDAGLLLDGATRLQLRFWQTSPYLLLFAFGATKWMIGVDRERPVGFLTVLLAVTAVLAVIRFAAVDRRTRAGQAAVAEAQSGGSRLRRAPAPDEADLAVALFGTAVLAGSPWSDYHEMRRSSGDGGSGGGDSGGGGDGGCGGGGCGGCGS
ncbi:MAG: TIGR04222 domain-containing membrane protein [Sphingomonas sp.]|uniref:TIGR04222 domain-containing membrane protein n=1 Tax=Sphingomonas sp. TaxID=28214 RepID=UPI0022739F22|nr:TIGR04222 domain-containing membrane protein [Sphingomonas sp.]MCX8476710.1 TIGR04222 domain-containing membrane protein [Sphingomonas sp.]